MHSRIIVLLLCCTALLTVPGCGSAATDASCPGAGIELTRHNPVSLENYRMARSYAAAGRYELAREHYLLAYAAAEDDTPLRAALERELRGIDMMIKTLR